MNLKLLLIHGYWFYDTKWLDERDKHIGFQKPYSQSYRKRCDMVSASHLSRKFLAEADAV